MTFNRIVINNMEGKSAGISVNVHNFSPFVTPENAM